VSERKFRIAVGSSRKSVHLRNKSVPWQTLLNKLSEIPESKETYDEYMAMSQEEQAEIKDVGFFIGGAFKPSIRKKANLLFRSVIALDVDHVESWDQEDFYDTYTRLGFHFAIHSTHKHSHPDPRLRLVVPLSKDIWPEQYEYIARYIANLSDMDLFDDTTFQATRIMYWPSCSKGADSWTACNPNATHFFDAEKLLADDNWEDWLEWPRSSRSAAARPPSKTSEDPYTKPGVIGAFNRAFEIPDAIIRFLPDAYEETQWDNRYTPVGSSGTPGGAIYYEDDGHLFSWHESDPCFNQNVSAFDLVRLHKFGDLDHGTNTPINKRESQKQMLAFAANLDDVRQAIVENEMEDLGPASKAKGNGADGEQLPTEVHEKKKSKLTFDALTAEIAALSEKATFKECKAVIPRIAAAKLDHDESGVLAAMLKDRYPEPQPTKADIAKQIEKVGRQLTAEIPDQEGVIADIEEDLVNEVLNENYEGGKTIKRAGRMFWDYQHGLWAPVNDEIVRGHLQHTLMRLRKDRPEELMSLVAAVGDNKTSVLTGNLWMMFTTELARREKRDDPLRLMRRFMEPVINCRNGEIHFSEQGELDFRDHDPDNFFTTQVDIAYNKDAKCPEWDRFMSMVWSEVGDPEDVIRHLEELGGYILQHSRSLKTWVLFHGPKDAGKSTVTEALIALLGSAVVTRPLAQYDGSNAHAEAGLVGKLMLVDDDFGRTDSLPDGFIKKISEEKPITANPKGKDEFQFVSRLLPIVCANHWPVTRDVSDAFVERALVFHFTHRIAGKEKSDKKKRYMLTNELPGILNRFIAGFQRLHVRGEWDIPTDCIIAHEDWRVHSNPVLMFVAELIHKAPGQHIKTDTLWMAYRTWSRENNPHGGVLKKQEFYDRMDIALGPRSHSVGVRVYADWSFIAGEEPGDI
jgi:P4 family phage/plasmid primase-like protien